MPALFNGFVLSRTEPAYTRDLIHARYRAFDFPGVAPGDTQTVVLHLTARIAGEYLVETYIDDERGAQIGGFRGQIVILP